MNILGNVLKLGILGCILTILVFGVSTLIDPGVSSLQKNKSKKFTKYSETSTPGIFEATFRLLSPEGRFTCSGAVVSDEYMVTAAHCVSDFKGTLIPKMKVQDETKTVTLEVNTVGLNHRLDYAVVQGNFTGFKKFKLDQGQVMLEDSEAPVPDFLGSRSGKKFKSCGYPMGLNKLYCAEYKPVQNFNFQVAGYGTLYPGMSGGPVFDVETNQVYAVNSAVYNNISIVAPLIGVLSAFELD